MTENIFNFLPLYLYATHEETFIFHAKSVFTWEMIRDGHCAKSYDFSVAFHISSVRKKACSHWLRFHWALSVTVGEADEAKIDETFNCLSLLQARAGKSYLLWAQWSNVSLIFCYWYVVTCNQLPVLDATAGIYENKYKGNLPKGTLQFFHQNIKGIFGNLAHASEQLQSSTGIDVLTLRVAYLKEKWANGLNY